MFGVWRTTEMSLVESCLCLASKGYPGFAQKHEMGIMPFRKPPRQPLPAANKQSNRVEHSIRRLKRFRTFAERCRNRQRRLGLRLHLLAGILNYEMGLAI